MKCKNYLFSVLFAFLGVFFGSFIINQNNTYATSVTCSLTSNLSSFSTSSVALSDYCDLSSLNSSVDWWWTFDFDVLDSDGNAFDFTADKQSTYGGLGQVYIFRQGRFLPANSCDSYVNAFCVSKNPYSILIGDYSSKTNNQHFQSLHVTNSTRWRYFSTLSITVKDSLSDCPSSPSGSLEITENGTYDVTDYAEAVVNVPETECPPSSGGNYHEDLVAINNSIMICAATCLVIYFFYCIYRMIIKNSGVK